MKPTLCSRCKKNVAVVFITRLDNNGQGGQNEGLCLKCARELNIRPVTDMIEKMGLSDEDLEGLTSEMMSAFEGAESMEGLLGNLSGALGDAANSSDDDEEEDGRTATFPFLNKLMGNLANPDGEKKEDALPDVSPQAADGGRSVREEKTERKNRTKRKFLENHCISLTRKAAEGKLDRMIGRDQELERVIQILNRRQKNNPCLIGEPGVGKTAIAEGLAMKIYQGDVPYKLKDKEVYLLDLTSLVAGTQFRGQFESRMKGLIEEIKKLGNIILVIDEVHNLVGAGDAEGSMNAANILKPALSRGEIQVIGATTLVEYRKYIEKDSALERRFQPVIVNEPSIEDAVEIIKGAVRAIRNVRTSMNVPPSKKAKVFVVSEDQEVREIFEHSKVFFGTLGYASEVAIQADKNGIAEDAVSAVAPQAAIYMPFAELVDIEKEVERLKKEEERLAKELARVNGMLNNEKFVSRAPQAKIDEEKAKLSKYTQMMDQVKERLGQLVK